jgi:hypothetical protein
VRLCLLTRGRWIPPARLRGLLGPRSPLFRRHVRTGARLAVSGVSVYAYSHS